MSLENNLRKSFAEVKKDILDIKNQILNIAEAQERLEAQVTELKKPSKKETSKKKK